MDYYQSLTAIIVVLSVNVHNALQDLLANAISAKLIDYS